MTNEIVKYGPELNTIPLRKFTPTEMNLFFSIISRMRDKGDNSVRFTFSQLKELSKYKATANSRFIDDISSTYKKILKLQFGSRSKDGLDEEMFVMFTRFEIKGSATVPYVDIQIYPKALGLLNNLESWVRYALAEFRNLQSSYSKTMFRLLKQYRTTGYAYFSANDFNELLDIPKSYRGSNINTVVLKPIKEELTPLFKDLKIKKVYGKGRGNPVKAYEFKWVPEKNNENDFFPGILKDQESKIRNILNNSFLSNSEKCTAIDRVKKQPLGTTTEFFLSKEEEDYSKNKGSYIDEKVHVPVTNNQEKLDRIRQKNHF